MAAATAAVCLPPHSALLQPENWPIRYQNHKIGVFAEISKASVGYLATFDRTA